MEFILIPYGMLQVFGYSFESPLIMAIQKLSMKFIQCDYIIYNIVRSSLLSF
jgi:hypothetical protein